MEKQILKDENRLNRKQILIDSCVKKESFTYPKQFASEELDFKKDELTQHCMRLSKLKDEKKEISKQFNADIKATTALLSSTLNSLRTGQEEVTEDVYLLDDQESGKMGYYNKLGELVYERPLMSEEKQLRIAKQLTGTLNN